MILLSVKDYITRWYLMYKRRLEKLDRLMNKVFRISELLNDISLELAVLIREITKDEIKNKTRFKAADTNKDGKVTLPELRAYFVNRIQPKRPSPKKRRPHPKNHKIYLHIESHRFISHIALGCDRASASS